MQWSNRTLSKLSLLQGLRWSQCTVRTCTRRQHALRCQNGLSEPMQASYTLCDKQNILNICKPPTRFAVIKAQGSKRTLQSSASPLQALRWSKRTLRTSTNLLHALRWSKRTPSTSKSLQHAFRWSKQTLRTTASLLHALLLKKNALSEPLRASYMLCGGQNALFKAL